MSLCAQISAPGMQCSMHAIRAHMHEMQVKKLNEFCEQNNGAFGNTIAQDSHANSASKHICTG